MKIKIIYRKDSRPITIESDKTTIEEISEDCARQLSRKYEQWRTKTGNPISNKGLKKYELGQKYMLMDKLMEKLNV